MLPTERCLQCRLHFPDRITVPRLVLFRGGLVLASKAAKSRKEDDVIVFSLSTENAAGTGGGTEEAALRDKIAGRDQNGAKGATGQDIQKYCLITV